MENKHSPILSLGVQDIFDLVVSANVIDNRGPVEKNFTQDQIEAVKKIRAARDNYERLGLPPGKVSFYGNFVVFFFLENGDR